VSQQHLKLSRPVLAGIYAGQINKWNIARSLRAC